LAGDLKLTVDITALTKAATLVKELDNQVINVKFNVTGAEDLTKLLSVVSSSSAGIDSATTSTKNLGDAITTVTSKDQFDNTTKSVEKYQISASKAVTTTTKFKKGMDDVTTSSIKQSDATKIELTNLGKKQTMLESIKKTQEQSLSKYADQSGLSSLKTDVEGLNIKSSSFANDYTKASQSLAGFKSEAQSAKYAQDQLTKANNNNLLSMSNIKESMKTAAVRTLEWSVTMGVLYGSVNAVKSMISNSVAISDQMTNIKMVTGSSDTEISGMLKGYQDVATELSSTTSQVAASAEVWARQGRSVSDTTELMKTSTVLSKVGFLDSAEAATLLTSSINGYGIAAKDAMSIVDKMSAIDVAAATSTEDLATGMAQTASGAKIAGVSLDELLSYIATITEVTQASGETVGQSLKTIFARMSKVKLGSLVDDDGEDISNVETVLSEYNVKLRDAQRTFRDTGTVLDELGVKWKTLGAAEKSEIAEQFAGVRQKEKFLVLMENYDKALNLQEISAGSAGSAMQKMSIWEESTEAATQRLTNQWEILSTTMIDSNFVKGIINLGAVSLSALSSDFGQMAIKIGLATAAFVAFNAVKNKATGAWAALDATTGTGALAGIKGVIEAQKAYQASLAVTKAAELAATGGELAMTASMGVLTTATVATETATAGLATATFAETVAVEGLGAALFGVVAAFAPIIAVVAAVGIGLAVVDAKTVSYSEHIKNIESLGDKISEGDSAISDTESELSQVKDRIEEINNLDPLDTSSDGELSNLEATNQQLQIKLDSLKQINKVTASQLSEEVIDTVGMKNKYSAVKTTYAGFTEVADKITTPDYVKEQMQLVEAVERAQAELEKNRPTMDSEEYVEAYDILSEKQKEYSLNANSSMIELTDFASQISDTTQEGRDQIKMIEDLSAALSKNNKLVDISSDKQSATEVASTFGGVKAGDVADYSGYMETINSGLETGSTDSAAFYSAMQNLFGMSPPTDILSTMSEINALFATGEGSEQGLIDTMAKWKTDGGYNLEAMKSELGLTDEAVATISESLFELGLIIPDALGSSAVDTIRTLGNGLDITADQSVNLENNLLGIYEKIGKDGFSEDDAKSEGEAFINSWVESHLLTPEDGARILQSWNDTIDTFSRESTKAIEGAQEKWANEFQQGLDEQTSRESYHGLANISIEGMFDTTQFESDLTTELQATNEYTDEEIAAIVEEQRTAQIALRIDALVDLCIPDTLGAEAHQQVADIINANTDPVTGEIDLNGVNVALTNANIEGVPAVQDQIIAGLGVISPKMMKVKAELDKTQAEADAKALEEDGKKQININANTSAYDSVIAGVLATETKTVNISTTNTVSQVIAASTSPFANTHSATGRVTVDTSKSGNESLVGEEGEEALLRNGKISFIGTKGAEIIPIHDGDTILPADITRKIKSGEIPMYADGKYSVSSYKSTSKTSPSFAGNTSQYQGANYVDLSEDEATKNAQDAHKKAFTKEYDYLQYLRDMDVIDEKSYYQQLETLNRKYFWNKAEWLDEYRSHEEEVYKYLKQLEEDRLNDLKDNYNATIASVENVIDKQIELINVTDDLAEAQLDYDNAVADKSVRVYKEGLGWNNWESDAEDVEEKRKALEVAKLESYKSKWSDLSNDYEAAQDDLIAKQTLGANYEEAVLEGRLDILTSFANKYSKVLSDLSSINGEGTIPLIDYTGAFTNLSSYAKGTTNASGGLSRINENGNEMRVLNSGDGILTASITRNLSALGSVAPQLMNSGDSGDINFNGDIILPNVKNGETFYKEALRYTKNHRR